MLKVLEVTKYNDRDYREVRTVLVDDEKHIYKVVKVMYGYNHVSVETRVSTWMTKVCDGLLLVNEVDYNPSRNTRETTSKVYHVEW